ncbi:MFS transporter [Nitratireductor basaltis]|uniref:Major facilitator family protein n=1 Tax=Nitratireductor basaltis TaxID=472175 RepID=A0A084UCD6_9HYPH|nr:MFS transporter [Nitratireductor basaltis]KFB10622.1 Major facilitator family protein [Nitratireductor basaltis]
MSTGEAADSGSLWREPRVLALLLAASLTVMANATISPALPGLQRMFGDNPNAALLTRLLVPAPSIVVIFAAPLAGLWADRYGKRPLLLAGIVIFILTGSAGLYLPSLEAVFASRLALGIGVAFIMSAQIALVGDYFKGARRSAMVGMEISARNVGAFLFIVTAGLIAGFNARLPFAIYLLPILFLPVVAKAIVEPRREDDAGDAKGHASEKGHPAWPVLFAVLFLAQMMVNMTFFIMPTQLPFYLDHMGYDAARMTGFGLGVMSLAGAASALQFRRLHPSLGFFGVCVISCGMFAAGFALLPQAQSIVMLPIAAILIGAGYALTMPNFVSMALGLVPAARRGFAGGALAAAIFLGQFISPFASQAMIEAHGFGWTYTLISMIVAVCVGLMLLVTASERVMKSRRSLAQP